MNPWYVELVIECEAAHDKECEHGEECPKRTSHIEQVFIRHALKDRVVTLQARLAAVEKLHQERPNSVSALYPTPLCSCGKEYPCATIKAARGE